MKRIALLHTVRSVYETFEGQLREAMSDHTLDISNTLDDFLSVDANRRGNFTQDNCKRLLSILQAKDLEHTDLIIVTCSTLTPAVEQIRPFINTHMLAIDDAMMEQAVQQGSNILIMATAASAMGPARQKLCLESEKIGKQISINEVLCTEAFKAIQQQDKKRHDKILIQAAANINHTTDVVVLSQASMAHMENEISKCSGIPTLSSPNYCLKKAEQILFGKVEEE